ncbi:dihydroorotate dehydrogenase electron transfer subunit, partial [Candidatus Woesearchaeota archaeon]|nr:dihydroorotate dehydrogenase electron transfer subunit [Candidatus Woesearchaeota archaeon]
MKDFPKTVKITKVVKENYKVKTFYLDINLKAKPGQFVMAWIPGVDEKPFTLSSIAPVAITVEEKGKFTSRMFKLKEGDSVGIRGPYGHGFSAKPNACIVAGGMGIAP